MATKTVRVNKKTLYEIVHEVQQRPCLWNTADEYYNNRGRVAVAWEEISAILNLPEALIRAKWKNMRDIFKREMKRCKYNSKGEFEYTGKWRHLKLMWFLHKPKSLQDEHNQKENSSSTETDIKEEMPIIVNSLRDQEESDDNNMQFEGSNIFSMDFQPEQDPLPLKRRRLSEDDYDLMFLKSLVPYLRSMDPVRKLRIRNRIQDIILNEIS
ncbi:uncharacterized protein LOC120629371 [Pararge aegeria]|uniref:Jg6767 protein n=1 Tax=Pararge aegeria aegeria TaxID=348720 RepID=A0A8S4RZ50_9NEOP|nr:uncharacterized protein LOC120629371 [Pararge aegeria]CAH2244451.1 jg6767 [Pararge aegeria aegeria]